MRNYVQKGDTLTVPAPAGGATSGAPVLIGALFGVAAADAIEGDDVAVSVEGVFDLPKATADAVSVGTPLFYDATNAVLTATDTNNTRVGYATAPAGTGAGNVTVKLTPGVA